MDIALKWLTLLHNPEDIVEIRSIDPKPVISGYFKADSAAIAKEIARFPNRTFYQTLQMVQPACYARGQHEHLMERPRETTSDNDIAGYQWILVDTDPVRPSGVSASQPEKEAARKVSATVMKKLMAMGFKEPIVADSGNGYHLLFKIHASTDDRQIIADFLSVLDKSTLVSQLGLAAITEGFKVAMFSGEMLASRVREWVLLQAAGPEYVEADKLNVNHYCLKPGIEQKLDAMLTGKLSIYDNDFGTNWEDVSNTIYDWVKENNASVAIIDNLMALDLPTGTMDKYDMQTRIVKRFSAMAKELKIHVHFICHPRKTEAFPRKGDISGTADITNVADNVFMVHRVNADFMSRYKMVYPKLEIPADVGNVIEIMKNRDLGVVDEMVMLYFDKRSRTMSDIKGLPPQYAWSEKIEQISMNGFTVVDNAELPDEWR